MSSNNLQKDYNDFVDNSVNASIRPVYDAGLFPYFDDEVDVRKDNFTFNKI